MPRNITVTLDDGSKHSYQNVPDDVTPEQVTQRAQSEFGKGVTSIDGGRGSQKQPITTADDVPVLSTGQVATPEQRKDTFADVANEAMSAVNRGGINAVDMLGWPIRETVNAALRVGGVDYQMPTLRSGLANTRATVEGGQMQDSLLKDAIRLGGEFALPSGVIGGGVRKVAQNVTPQMTAANANAVLPNIGRQLSQGSVKADIGYGAASGAGSAVGQEIGGDTGAIVGTVAAPFLAAGTIGTVKAAGDYAKNAFNEWKNPSPKISGSTAERNRIIMEALQRSGMSAQEAQDGIKKLGTEGMMADLSPAFSRQLKAIVNENPQLEGIVGKSLSERSREGYSRLQNEVSASLGRGETVDDAIGSLESTMTPRINELYRASRETPFAPSERLRKIMEGDNPLAEAVNEAGKNLATRRIMGETVGNMALVDEAKKVLDGRIGEAVRSGNKSKVRDLTMLKKFMLDEADAASPEWAAARSLFAGKQALKDAADLGNDFFKMSADDVKGLANGFGESEKHFYKLGAQQAILNKLDSVNITSDAAKAILSKNGDLKKISTLFNSNDEFNSFVAALNREAKFKATANAVFGNSTTAKQASDLIKLREGAGLAAEAVSSPLGSARAIGNIVAKLSAGKSTQDFKDGMYQAGLILSEKGLDNKLLFKMLKNQEAENLRRSLEDAATRPSKALTSKSGGVITGLQSNQQENKQKATQ